MPKVFRGKTLSLKDWKRRQAHRHAERLGGFLGSKVEFVDGRGVGVKEWNFLQLRNVLAESLRRYGLEVTAKKVEACHRDFHGYGCEANPSHVWGVPDYTCHLRLCPFEMKARSNRARKAVEPEIRKLKRGKFLVVSRRNCALDELGEGIGELFSCFTRLYRRFLVSKYGARGAFAALEVTYNPADRTWHPHLNVVLDCSKFVPHRDLLEAWMEITGGEGRGAWVGGIDKGTCSELLKYITKLVDFIDCPEAVGAFLQASKRRRFIRSYGTLYGLDYVDSGEDTSRFRCPDCGCPKVKDLGVIQRELVFWDANGQTRFVSSSDP